MSDLDRMTVDTARWLTWLRSLGLRPDVGVSSGTSPRPGPAIAVLEGPTWLEVRNAPTAMDWRRLISSLRPIILSARVSF